MCFVWLEISDKRDNIKAQEAHGFTSTRLFSHRSRILLSQGWLAKCRVLPANGFVAKLLQQNYHERLLLFNNGTQVFAMKRHIRCFSCFLARVWCKVDLKWSAKILIPLHEFSYFHVFYLYSWKLWSLFCCM